MLRSVLPLFSLSVAGRLQPARMVAGAARPVLAAALGGALMWAPPLRADHWSGATIKKTGQGEIGISLSAGGADDQAGHPGPWVARKVTVETTGMWGMAVLLNQPGGTLSLEEAMVSSSGDLGLNQTYQPRATVMVRAGALNVRGSTIRNRYRSGSRYHGRKPAALRLAGEQASLSMADSLVEGERGMRLINTAQADIVRSIVRGLDGEGLSMDHAAKARLTDAQVLGKRAGRVDGAGELIAHNTRFSGKAGLLLSSKARADLSGGTLAASEGVALYLYGDAEAQLRDVEVSAQGRQQVAAIELVSALAGDAAPDSSEPPVRADPVLRVAGGSISAAGVESPALRLAGGLASLDGVHVLAEAAPAAELIAGTLSVAGGTLYAERGPALSTGKYDDLLGAAQVFLGGGAVAPRDRMPAVTVTVQRGASVGGAQLLRQTTPIPVRLVLRDAAVAQGDVVRAPEDAPQKDSFGMQVPPGLRVGLEQARLELDVADGARWHGATQSLDRLVLGAGGQWRMSAASSVGDLSMEPGAAVVFGDTAGPGFQTLTLRTLAGAGSFEMHADAGLEHADQLVVTEQAEGRHRVRVRAPAGAEPGKAQAVLVRAPADSAASFELDDRDGRADFGTYRYGLAQQPDGAWGLVRTGYSATAAAALDTGGLGAPQGLWYAEANALGKRMGELRLNPDAGGAWGRAFSQRQRIGPRAGRHFQQDVSGIEMGADQAWLVAGGRWHAGGLLGYTRARRGFAGQGKGHTDSVHVGGYATYIGTNGVYADATLRASRFENTFDVARPGGGRTVSGSYRANGVGMTLEAGRRLALGRHWFVEPQAELAWFRAGGGTYRASNGLRIEDDGGTSLQARLGAQAGRRFDLRGGAVVQPYARLSWVQELKGVSTVRTNGIAHRTDLGAGRVELGLGVAAALGKGHNLYASYEYSHGPRLSLPWTVQLGYRYAW
ncbi:autotransporter outer membrane beta-barrel domain-containing protein [Bordetella bronchiseptica]|nr:autotransporter outer membrane beta-barrel domain-containing protein [Bordetella bronchiseptica]AZW44028.1 autotransporter outer membrane beta-barrel domain-containing protein [Bordetella bronchiseptica]